MADRTATALRHLVRLSAVHGPGVAAQRLALLHRLERGRLSSARQVLRLHETLCVLRAHPDDAAVLACVERLLERFAARADLRRWRRALADSGIAGTEIRFRFFWFTARWLVHRWPQHVQVDWSAFEQRERLAKLLPLLLPRGEALVHERTDTARAWLRRLAGPGETDAAFLVRRFEALQADGFVCEHLYEDLDPALRLVPGADTPSRTRARFAGVPVVFGARPGSRRRPDLRRELHRPPLAVRDLDGPAARRAIDLARESMVTRSRDLDAFEHADRRDARLVDCGGGLRFACFGMRPERRLLLDCNSGWLMLQNGVPIGYVLTSALFGSAAVAYNVFETFRGGPSAAIYGRVLATARHLFGCDAFSIDPYQLGHHNPEGLRSGAWWFYFKLGFRPREAGVRRLAAAERARLRRHPGQRTGAATLRRLAAAPLFWSAGRARPDVIGRIDLGRIGLRVSERAAARYGADRERGVAQDVRDAARLLGVGTRRGWTADERRAFEAWAPLVMTLQGVEGWSPAARRALGEVVRAKGGRRESEFVRRFDRHVLLRQAVLRLAAH